MRAEKHATYFHEALGDLSDDAVLAAQVRDPALLQPLFAGTTPLAEAEKLHGPLERPPTLVTDNGSNSLARRFQRHIKGVLSQVRTRCRTLQQLGLLERFHQTLKQEEVYGDIYRSPGEARDRPVAFHQRYHEVRPHWALVPLEGGDPIALNEVYRNATPIQLPACPQN